MMSWIWISALFAINAGDASAAQAQTPNFLVCTEGSFEGQAEELALDCEKLRSRLQERWSKQPRHSDWEPRCKVVLHQTRMTYQREVGPGGQQTYGSSLIEREQGRVVRRRIDVLADERGGLSALSHELTHIVLGDLFEGQIPPWADEGIATLSDAPTKQQLHHRDCLKALQDGNAFRLVELLTLTRLRSSTQRAAFYGQSLSLVRYLADQADSPTVIRFVQKAEHEGYDSALRDVYAIDGVAQLERQWLGQLRSHSSGREGG